MMGANHALSGVSAGLATAPLLGLAGTGQTVAFTVIVAGYSVVPDIDCASSAATRRLGGLGEKASARMRQLSAWTYARTKGSRDERHEGIHRHLTHTFVFALVLGGIAAGLAMLSPWAALPFYAVAALLAADRIGDWVIVPAAGGLTAAAIDIVDRPGALTWQIGAAVALGCATHCLGDALTVSGCPFLWGILPFEIRGETWYEIRLLGPLSFHTGGNVEKWLVRPLLWAVVPVAGWPILEPFLGPTLRFVGGLA